MQHNIYRFTMLKFKINIINKGLTLIEVLVALMIISTSLLAAQRTICNTINNYGMLQKNIIASILSRNILTELILSQKVMHKGRYLCEENMPNFPFECQINIKSTPNKYIFAAEILVYANKNSQTPLERSFTLLPKSAD